MERYFLNTDEVASLLLTSKEAIHVLASRRQIPQIKRGRRLLFNRAEIFEWLEAQRRVSKDEAIRESVGT